MLPDLKPKYRSAGLGVASSNDDVAPLTPRYTTGSLRLRNPAGTAELNFDLLPFFRGPRGADATAIFVVAAEPLGGQRVVTSLGFLCGPEDANAAVGITKTAAIIGDEAEIVSQGPMTEVSWTWTPNQPIFIGAAGVLTQTPPGSGLLRRIAWALNATTIHVDFLPPISQA